MTALVSTASAAPLPRLRVSDNKRFLVTADGKPFFWLGDTAWELFHRLNREEAIYYLDTRARQGFNVVQAVVLAEADGLNTPNAYGKLPLVDRDPARPAISTDPKDYDYWDHVDFVIDEAAQRGIYVALVPTWANWVVDDKTRVFTPENARAYGEFLGRRYRERPIIWVLGGDRKADGFEEIWRAMARGIAVGVTGREDYGGVLMTFHPPGTMTSSTWFHNEPWLDFNLQQTGQRPAHIAQTPDRIAKDYARTPVKPVFDGEALYEDHPIRPDPALYGYSFDAHIRQRAYWSVFAGGFGVTYGHHSVWQMYAPGRSPISGPLVFWQEALERPGATQMRHLRALIESRPFLSRVPDQSLIVDALNDAERIQATRGDDYLFVYSGAGRPFTVNLGRISGATLKGYWYNPRNGAAFPIGSIENTGTRTFTLPSLGFGSDWVLVLDDAAKGYPPPGSPIK